jgi:hypothetical protein
MEKERQRNDFARRFIEWTLQNPGEPAEIFLRENRKELEELAKI